MAFDKDQPAHVALKKVLAERTAPLVAWVGAGLSAPAGLPSWLGLLDHLIGVVRSKNRGLADAAKDKREATLHALRAKKDFWMCFQLLKDILGATTYAAEIRERLDAASTASIPETYRLLWKTGVQGIVTLNLDQFSSRSYSSVFPGAGIEQFVGHQSKNLFSVLQRNRKFVANVHGVVDDSSSWIFTHDELRRLLSDKGYKSFISASLITRTIVFVGVSADDIAVATHLSAVVAGGTGLSHFWITSRTDSETDQWGEDIGLRVIRYDATKDHSELEECLRDLADAQLSKDVALADPVLLAQSTATLLGPDELVRADLETIRSQLNSHALSIFAAGGTDRYEKFEQFEATYDEAIDRAWYVSLTPPKNLLFGYTLVRPVAQGSFGDVFEATSPDGETVAVKLLRRDVRREPAMLQTFRRGVRSMKILRAHKVPGMVEFVAASEIPAMVVMEWIEGPNLNEAIEGNLLQTWEEKLTVCRDLAKIILSAHLLPERVLHRDIRPPNVMLKHFWDPAVSTEVVVMDFDLSWHFDALEKSIVAKPLGYMAPEQLHSRGGNQTRNALVDSYGFGMTLFYVLTGEVPVPEQPKHGDWVAKLRNRISARPCQEWKSLPHRCARIVLHATKYDQRGRLDFSRITTEMEMLCLAIQGQKDLLPLDYLCEEIAANAETMMGYDWTDETGTAVYRSGGLVVAVEASLTENLIKLAMEWRQTGEENWKLWPKTGAEVAERAKPTVEKFGWTGARFEGSYGYVRVSATYEPDPKTFNASKLGAGVDALTNVMRPKT
jgi:serine/threonine protein kinase